MVVMDLEYCLVLLDSKIFVDSTMVNSMMQRPQSRVHLRPQNNSRPCFTAQTLCARFQQHSLNCLIHSVLGSCSLEDMLTQSSIGVATIDAISSTQCKCNIITSRTHKTMHAASGAPVQSFPAASATNCTNPARQVRGDLKAFQSLFLLHPPTNPTAASQ